MGFLDIFRGKQEVVQKNVQGSARTWPVYKAWRDSGDIVYIEGNYGADIAVPLHLFESKQLVHSTDRKAVLNSAADNYANVAAFYPTREKVFRNVIIYGKHLKNIGDLAQRDREDKLFWKLDEVESANRYISGSVVPIRGLFGRVSLLRYLEGEFTEFLKLKAKQF